MREAEEEEKMEKEQKQIAPNTPAPQITAMTDEDLLAEMRRRADVKQGN